ncbi:MAG TPA: LLM class flavin-dependent oxidoreductase, partial [Reyranella sp.]|nr:LLM class flavin-dependent oxidoreductase [Reyranella sp.]
RPRPISNPERRFYASSVSPESAEVIAKLGFGMLMIMQNEWAKCRQDIDNFQAMSVAAGHVPKPPVILTNVSCAESREEATERAFKYLGRKWQSIDDHYHFSDGHLANVKGYEAYGKTAKTYAKLKDPANLKKATDFYVSIQIVGTPDDCLQQLGRLQQVTGLEHLVAEFSWGNLPHHEAETNMRLFAERCLPALQNDKAFATPKRAIPDASAPHRGAEEGIFAPA